MHHTPCLLKQVRGFRLLGFVGVQWRHSVRDGVLNHRRLDCLLYRLYRRRSRKLQSSASLAVMRGIHLWPMDSPLKGPVTRYMFPCDDVTIQWKHVIQSYGCHGASEAIPRDVGDIGPYLTETKHSKVRTDDNVHEFTLSTHCMITHAHGKDKEMGYLAATSTWWCHQMETFSVLLVFCEGKPTITGGLPSQSPVTWSFDVFFDLRLNKRLSKQSSTLRFETPSRSL